MEGVIGKFKVPGLNENGRKLIELCTEKRMTVEEAFFCFCLKRSKLRNLHGLVREEG